MEEFARCQCHMASFRAIVGLGVFLVSGCGLPRDYPPLGHVTGAITLDGQPVEGASVSFFPEEGRSSTASTDAQGRYDLVFVSNVRGAAVGDHVVSISKIVPDPKYVPYALEKSAYDPGPAMINLVPSRYSGTRSELRAVVKEGRNVVDFQLESKKSKK